MRELVFKKSTRYISKRIPNFTNWGTFSLAVPTNTPAHVAAASSWIGSQLFALESCIGLFPLQESGPFAQHRRLQRDVVSI